MNSEIPRIHPEKSENGKYFAYNLTNEALFKTAYHYGKSLEEGRWYGRLVLKIGETALDGQKIAEVINTALNPGGATTVFFEAGGVTRSSFDLPDGSEESVGLANAKVLLAKHIIPGTRVGRFDIEYEPGGQWVEWVDGEPHFRSRPQEVETGE